MAKMLFTRKGIPYLRLEKATYACKRQLLKYLVIFLKIIINSKEGSRARPNTGLRIQNQYFKPLLWIQIRIRIILGLPDPDPLNLDLHLLFCDTFDFLSIKIDVNVPSKSNKQKLF